MARVGAKGTAETEDSYANHSVVRQGEWIRKYELRIEMELSPYDGEEYRKKAGRVDIDMCLQQPASAPSS
jgi:hypothetical protein